MATRVTPVVMIPGNSDIRLDDCYSCIHKGGESGTLETMIESEYETFSTTTPDFDFKEHGDPLDDSSSCSSLEAAEAHIHDRTIDCSRSPTTVLRNKLVHTRIPSSVHLVGFEEDDSNSNYFCLNENDEEEKEEEVVDNFDRSFPSSQEVDASPLSSQKPKSVAWSSVPLPLSSSSSSSAPMRTFSYIPRSLCRSESMPMPRRSSLKRTSAYSIDTSIPLDFQRRGSLKVLPKPDPTLLELAQLPTRTPQQHRQLLRPSSCLVRSQSLPNPPPCLRRPQTSNRKRRVSFTTIQVREHRRTMGDNPSCSYGTPVALDWEFLQLEDRTVEEHETFKYSEGNGRRGRPRRLTELHLNHYQRRNILRLEGFTLEEIKAQKRETNKSRRQREMTRLLAQASFVIMIEDMVESAGRKVQRALTTKKCPTSPPPQRSLSTKELLKIMDGDRSNETVSTAAMSVTFALP